MLWRRLGKIFDPTEQLIFGNRMEYAKSPQAVVFEGFVRVFFSVCSRDHVNGKLLSHVAYVDFTKDFKKIITLSKEAIIPLGELGCFDEHGIFPFSVTPYQNKIYAYTSGWSRRVSVSVETGIGLAISDDNGNTFHKFGSGPVLSSSLKEPFLVVDGFVRIYNNTFHMWHLFGTNWKLDPDLGVPERTYKIGHATSCDGIRWIKEEGRAVIPDLLGVEESQALPCVFEHKGIYHMYFCYRQSFNFRNSFERGYRIGHAWTEDLINWTRSTEDSIFSNSAQKWETEMQCYPNIIEVDDSIYMLYNGNEFGRFGFGVAILEG